jgi:hypothetical protein
MRGSQAGTEERSRPNKRTAGEKFVTGMTFDAASALSLSTAIEETSRWRKFLLADKKRAARLPG